jgi:hypothetical protein
VTEGDIKAKLVKKLRDETPFTVVRHEDKSTAGLPDIEVTGNGRTTWWEVKYGRPDSPWKTKGIQHLHMLKLAARGFARYILFDDTGTGLKLVAIAHPRTIGKTRKADRKETWDGAIDVKFNYDWVVKEIERVHNL